MEVRVLCLFLTVPYIGMWSVIVAFHSHAHFQAISERIPLFFAHDHVHFDMLDGCDKLTLKQMHSDVYTEISRDQFAICKIEKAFSMIAIDQAYKQNIAIIIGDRSAISLTEDRYKAFFPSLSTDTS